MVASCLSVSLQVLDIVRAAENLAMGNALTEAATLPPKSPVDFHEEKMTKTTTVVMSKHTLDTQPQVFTRDGACGWN